MKNNKNITDLTKQPPRSPHIKVGGFCILGRTIDKCRALLFGKIGEYHYDCPLDNQLFSFMGIKGDDLKAFIAKDHSDEEIAEWVKSNGMKKTEKEISDWNEKVSNNNYSSQPPEKKAWLEGENKRLGLDKDGTLFDFLDADDKASFKK